MLRAFARMRTRTALQPAILLRNCPVLSRSCTLGSGALRGVFDERTYDKERYNKVSLVELLSVLRHERMAMALATTGILGASISSMAIPGAVGIIIDALNNPSLPDASSVIMNESLRMLAIFSGGALATFVKVSQIQIIGQRVGRDLRKQLFASLISQEAAFFDANRSGELANRLSTDVHEVAEHLVENVSVVGNAAVTAAVAGAFMMNISPALAAITFAVVPAMAYGGTWYGRRVKKFSQAMLAALAGSTQMAMERFSGVVVVKSYNGEKRAVQEYSKVIDDCFKLARRLATAEGVYLSVIFMTSSVTLLAVLWFGGHMVMTGNITVGALASFGMYAYQLGDSVSEITEGTAGTLKAQGSASRLFTLLHRKSADVRKSVSKVLADSAVRGPIVFENVHFAYPARPTKQILMGATLTLEPGEVVGITGASGCGKSTLGLLLQKLYPLNGGRISVAGTDLNTLDTKWWRSQVAVVTQDPMLFSGSIGQNISYGRPQATQDEIEFAAKAAWAHEFILAMPQGYNTPLGERGVSLSGGQKQRIAIARAILATPQILILDEATSALDREHEQKVQASLKALMKQCTCLVISHHPFILQETNRVIVLDQGRVVQDGPFHVLAQDTEGVLLSLLRYEEDD